MRLAAVVVHYRTPDLLARCLGRIEGFDQVVVVDNASRDGTVERVRRAWPEFTLVEAERNRGFGAGANLGVAAAENADAVVLLNPDAFAHPELARQVKEGLAGHQQMWVGGCRLEAADGSPQTSGRRFYTPLSLVAKRLLPRSRSARRNLLDGWDRATDRTVDWVPGSGMVLTRSAFERLGGFDERYFMYFEDVDLCLRAWQAGGEVWYLSGARVTHDERRASAKGFNRALLWHLRAYVRFVRKWGRTALRPPGYGDRSSILSP